jgi:hypothetical protein
LRREQLVPGTDLHLTGAEVDRGRIGGRLAGQALEPAAQAGRIRQALLERAVKGARRRERAAAAGEPFVPLWAE